MYGHKYDLKPSTRYRTLISDCNRVRLVRVINWNNSSSGEVSHNLLQWYFLRLRSRRSKTELPSHIFTASRPFRWKSRLSGGPVAHVAHS